LNVMSDDEQEKKSFQPAIQPSEPSGSSTSKTTPLRKRDDRADKVRSMVNSSTKKCFEQEALIKQLEWQLTEELSQSRRISNGISETAKRLESRQQMFKEIINHALPSISSKVDRAKRKAEFVRSRLQKTSDTTIRAEERYSKDRVKAQALEQHLLWRMRPWYNKMMAYLRGERRINWHDTSPHRIQNITTAAIWGVGIVLLALALAIFVYMLLWNR